MSAPRWLAALARARVVHFAIGGGLLFAVARPPAAADDPGDLRLSAARIDALVARALARDPSQAPAALRAEITRQAIEDEVLAREAVRFGLDRGDDIIRARLVQKMLFVAEDLAGAARPATEAELRVYFDAHRDVYQRGVQLELVQVMAASLDEAAALRPQVVRWSTAHPGEVPPLGRGAPQPRRLAVDERGLRAGWGDPFATAVLGLAPGAWSAPLASPRGVQLVQVLRREEARPATFAEVRDRLPLDLQVARRQAAIAAFVATAASHYRVRIDGAELPVIASRDRVAPRTAGSVED